MPGGRMLSLDLGGGDLIHQSRSTHLIARKHNVFEVDLIASGISDYQWQCATEHE